MKSFLEKIRKPRTDIPLNKQIAETIGIILFGLVLGVLQKWIDGTAANALPVVMQQLDIGNYFGRLAIWILLVTIISVYAKSPLRAAINTFFFFISMLAGYYLYCNYILGFLPKTYMMIWIVISFATFFMAYVCWYAKGYHCNIHIKYDYGCFTCTGISSKYHPGVLYVSLFRSAYVDHECNTFEKKTERICYGNRIIRCDSICVSADYAILGIKTNFTKVSALRGSYMEKIIKEVGR